MVTMRVDGMSYRQLQQHAKAIGVRANGRAALLREAVRLHLEGGQTRRGRKRVRSPPAPTARQQQQQHSPVARRRVVRASKAATRAATKGCAENDESSDSDAASILRSPELQLYSADDRWCIDRSHLTAKVAVLQKAAAVENVRCLDLLPVFDATEITDEMRERWTDYYGHTMFTSRDEIRGSLHTLLEWADRQPETHDGAQRMRFVARELLECPGQHDEASIFLALAQNGRACDVQKEVGVRAVYADMQGTAADDAEAGSAASQVLRELMRLRENLSELQSAEVLRGEWLGVNTHLIVPIRNSYAHLAGISTIPDVHTQFYLRKYLFMTEEEVAAKADGWFDRFMQLYTAQYAVSSVLNAVNNTPRKVSYDAVVNWFSENRPPDVPAYGFLSHFVFDCCTGAVTEQAVRYLLHRLSVLAPEQPAKRRRGRARRRL
eukprot:TRINITY_DN6705_c0_g2_i3.p1 TRINITY_DN6705_c0_g2~~TRINITY_DN6705_c0_g2_i3.p1  ORF type:complete len:436 (+),score=153.17 TRINITY_DN6705_c0_g2_i3:834-2141(+)